MSWEVDTKLKARLEDLVCNNYIHSEILSFVREEFRDYSWSLRTLRRRLNHFNLKHNDTTISPQQLLAIVEKELNGPGRLLGYRALHKKIRNEYKLRVKRSDVYLTMNHVNPEGLEMRRLVNKRKKFHKREFKSKGANYLWSLDGHDKLMGRTKSEFPLGIHGCIDTFSRKILWLVVWPSNSDPELPGKLFHDAIITTGYLPQLTRSDRGSENVIVATMQNYLHQSPDTTPSHLFGSSITNIVIEQWWRGFRERHREYFKSLVHTLVTEGYYDSANITCRVLLAFVFVPLIQESLDSFKKNWNTHRIRKQNIYRPCGIPNYLYNFSDKNGGKQCGIIPNVERMKKVGSKLQYKNLKFLSQELEDELAAAVKSAGLELRVASNAKECYLLLWNQFQGIPLNFSFS